MVRTCAIRASRAPDLRDLPSRVVAREQRARAPAETEPRARSARAAGVFRAFCCSGVSMQASSAQLPPLGELGWRGKFQHDSPEVQQLRTELRDLGGIAGLELVDSAAPDFAATAAKLFHRDGFVLVRDALPPERAAIIRRGCDTVIREMVALDPERLGSRGSHRYAFGNAPAHFGCAGDWACLVDNPVALTVVEAIFESPAFCCTGFGGDFVLPGAVEFQDLHRDMQDYLHDPTGKLNYLDLPCPQVVVNYPMIVDVESRPVTTLSGATRQIPGTQNSQQPIPTDLEEPTWMKCSIAAPVPPGCALFRDVRCWVTLLSHMVTRRLHSVSLARPRQRLTPQ